MRKLQRLILIHRHGDRCPGVLGSCSTSESDSWRQLLPPTHKHDQMSQRYPIQTTHPNKPKNRGSNPPIGRLTERGSKQLHALGRQLRQRYPLVTRNPTVWSSNYYRTQQSAQSLLVGMDAQPGTKINVRESEKCSIDAFSRYAHIHELCSTMAQSAAFQAHEESHQLAAIKQQLETLPCFADDGSQSEGSEAWQWFTAVDVLTCHKYHPQVHKPKSIATLLPLTAESEEYMLWRFLQYYGNEKVLRLACGDLLAEIVHLARPMQLQDSKNDSKKELPLTVYSGHDVTVMPLALALGHSWKVWPDYGSHIIIEIWESSSTPSEENPSEEACSTTSVVFRLCESSPNEQQQDEDDIVLADMSFEELTAVSRRVKPGNCEYSFIGM